MLTVTHREQPSLYLKQENSNEWIANRADLRYMYAVCNKVIPHSPSSSTTKTERQYLAYSFDQPTPSFKM